jgi:hypothetical protein
MVSNKEGENAMRNSEERFRVFWRILFDVTRRPRLRKEWTLWDVSGPVTKRLDRRVERLNWSPEGGAQIEADKVVFAGGYLRCEDKTPHPDHINYLFGITLDPEGLSRANQGENVSVWAEVYLPDEDGTFPLFYYPQNGADYLALSVVVGASNNRGIHWKIADLSVMESLSYTIDDTVNPKPYLIDDEDGPWHRVKVRQDYWSGDNYFEFLVDSIPRSGSNIGPDGDFVFNIPPDIPKTKDFYIGRVRDPGNYRKWLTLHGELRQLEFDPNDSCTSCHVTEEVAKQ